MNPDNFLSEEVKITLGQQMNKFLVLPKVDFRTGEYADNNGEIWVAGGFFIGDGLTYRNIDSYFKGVRAIQGRDRIGQRTTLYNKQEGLITRNDIRNFSVPTELANEQLRSLLEE